MAKRTAKKYGNKKRKPAPLVTVGLSQKPKRKSLKGANNPQAKTEQRLRAKAMYLDANGKLKMKDIADEVGVTADTVGKWKKDGDWENDLQSVQDIIRDKLSANLLVSSETRSLLADMDDAQIESAVDALVGKTVSEAVSDFLTKVHKQDLQDLSELNRALRMYLHESRIVSLKPMDIVNLVNAKTNIIKNVRLIFGKSTDIVEGKAEEGKGVTIILDKRQAESITTIQQLDKNTLEIR